MLVNQLIRTPITGTRRSGFSQYTGISHCVTLVEDLGTQKPTPKTELTNVKWIDEQSRVLS